MERYGSHQRYSRILKYEISKAKKLFEDRLKFKGINSLLETPNYNYKLYRNQSASKNILFTEKSSCFIPRRNFFDEDPVFDLGKNTIIDMYYKKKIKRKLLTSKLTNLHSYSPQPSFNQKLPKLSHLKSNIEPKQSPDDFSLKVILKKERIGEDSLKKNYENKDESLIVNQETQTDEISYQLLGTKKKNLLKLQIKCKNFEGLSEIPNNSLTPEAPPNHYQKKFFRKSANPVKK